MKKALKGAVLYLAAACLLAACKNQQAPVTETSHIDGAGLYRKFCARCHGPNAGGTEGSPTLIADHIDRKGMLYILQYGSSRMPSFQSILTVPEREAITDFILSLRQLKQ